MAAVFLFIPFHCSGFDPRDPTNKILSMARRLHIDIETFSSVDIKTSGAYKYTQSLDFEILLVAYAFDDEPIKIIDLAQGEELPREFIEGLLDPEVHKCAHNATFERNAFVNMATIFR